MSDASTNNLRLAGTLILVFGSGLMVYPMAALFGDSALVALRWQNLPFHATVEAAGAMFALMAANLLLRLDEIHEGSSFNQRIAAALIAMGVLDGLHAMMTPGQSFVWLHTSATLFGGLLFALVWLPNGLLVRATQNLPQWAFLLASLFGTASLLMPEQMPSMLEQGQFTPVFEAMNIIGGVLLLTAAARIAHRYYRSQKTEDLLFCLQCALLGFGALVLGRSNLWNVPWWGSHLLRLLAYAIALWLLMRVAEERTRHALRLLELEASNLRLKVLSATDGLTGIANRRSFDEMLQNEWRRSMRSQQPLALALIDVDMFKKYNDSHGHQAGDECLRRVAAVLSSCMRRPGDLAARYGGEEFALVAPGTDTENAMRLAESVRGVLQALALPYQQSSYGCVTVSVGVACAVAVADSSAEELLHRADAALYRAKSQGRNCVVLATGNTDASNED